MKSFKTGVSYNVFDGVELLEDSINHIRESVDYISVVFQTTSYYGEKLSENEISIVESLSKNGLIDDLFYFELNKSKSIHQNQLDKRNKGRDLAKNNDCTHYMSLDCDEFYITNDFNKLVEYHKNNPNVITYLPLVAYYKDTKYLIDSSKYMDGDLFVSGFFPVKYKFILNHMSTVKVDPTRKVGVSSDVSVKVLDSNFIKMHHLSYVRKDIYKKINNAASKLRYGNNIKHFNNVLECYLNFEKNKIALSADGDKYNIIEIDPEIVLNKYYSNIK